MADDHEQGEGEHHQGDVAMPAMPASGLVVGKAEFGFGGLEGVLDRPAPPSTSTSTAIGVPFGHQVEKNALLPSLRPRRISRPRVHIVDAERQSKKLRASRSASST